MNLALLDPFRRQIPDRIDSTLTIPRALHPSRPSKKKATTRDGGGAAASSGGDGGGGKSKQIKTPKTPKSAKNSKAAKTTPKSAKAIKAAAAAALSKEDGLGKIPKKSGMSKEAKPSKSSTKLFKHNIKLKKNKLPASAAAVAEDAEGAGNIIKNDESFDGNNEDDKELAGSSQKRKKNRDKHNNDVTGGGESDVVMEDVNDGQTGDETREKSEKKELIEPLLPKSKNDLDKDNVEMEEADNKQKHDGEVKVNEGDDDGSTNNLNTKQKKKQLKKKTKSNEPPSPTSHLLSMVGSSSSKIFTNTDEEDSEEEDGDDDDDDVMEAYWTACYAVSFNRRGSFLASGHASGLVPCHDFMSRTVSALYSPPPGIVIENGKKNGSVGYAASSSAGDMSGDTGGGGGGGGREKDKSSVKKGKSSSSKKTKKEKEKASDNQEEVLDSKSPVDDIKPTSVSGEKQGAKGTQKSSTDTAAAKSDNKGDTVQHQYVNGVTSISWDHRSRTLLAGAIGDHNLRLMDNTHPQVCLDCVEAVRKQWASGGGGSGNSNNTSRKSGSGNDDPNDHLFTPDGKNSRDSFSMLSPPIVTSFASPSSQTKGTPIQQHNQDLSTPQLLQHHHQEQLAKGGTRDSLFNEKETGEQIQVRLETVSFGKARLLRGKVISFASSSPTESEEETSLPKPPPTSWTKTLSLPSTFDELDQAVKKRKQSHSPTQNETMSSSTSTPILTVPAMRHPTLLLELPQPLGGPAQLHPRDNHAGLACMIDGSLSLFWIPPLAFYETMPSLINDKTSDDSVSASAKGKTSGKRKEDVKDKASKAKMKWVGAVLESEEANMMGNVAYLIPPPKDQPGTSSPHYFVTCAAFGKNGDVLYAVTKCGTLLGYRIHPFMMNSLRGEVTSSVTTFANNYLSQPSLCVKVPGGAAAWQIIVSRNGKFILINSADCALRLYDAEELNDAFTDPLDETGNSSNVAVVKPCFVFQDLVSKAPWASCDFSGDGEYVVGGCNSYPQPGDNYQLFLWNTVTGDLLDQLTGPQVSLYSLSCHPARPFIAVGTSDGLVDIWGPRLDWTAFAPDFQALQQNILYSEREDEFDIVIDGEEGEKNRKESVDNLNFSEEDEHVDITTIAKVPAFDSDSEDETEVFYFDTKVMKILSDKASGKKADHD